jgi:hypothetical protein
MGILSSMRGRGMDAEVIKNAVGSLESLLSDAKDALWQVQGEVFHQANTTPEKGSFDHPRGAMEGYLRQIHDVLLVVLEAGNLPQARASLKEAWPGFESKKNGLGYTADDGIYDSCSSPALTFFERMIEALRMAVSQEITSEQAWELSRLERMLSDTAGLVYRREKTPTTEAQIQEVMHDYLGVCFASFCKDPIIKGAIKDFKPDCGIKSVNAAIEFKFVATDKHRGTAFGGIAEDTAGYKGSKDWTRFYAVICQAKPTILNSQLQSDMGRIGALTWTTFLVNLHSEIATRKTIKTGGRLKGAQLKRRRQ